MEKSLNLFINILIFHPLYPRCQTVNLSSKRYIVFVLWNIRWSVYDVLVSRLVLGNHSDMVRYGCSCVYMSVECCSCLTGEPLLF